MYASELTAAHSEGAAEDSTEHGARAQSTSADRERTPEKEHAFKEGKARFANSATSLSVSQTSTSEVSVCAGSSNALRYPLKRLSAKRTKGAHPQGDKRPQAKRQEYNHRPPFDSSARTDIIGDVTPARYSIQKGSAKP